MNNLDFHPLNEFIYIAKTDYGVHYHIEYIGVKWRLYIENHEISRHIFSHENLESLKNSARQIHYMMKFVENNTLIGLALRSNE